jgi:hypothetical protein
MFSFHLGGFVAKTSGVKSSNNDDFYAQLLLPPQGDLRKGNMHEFNLFTNNFIHVKVGRGEELGP